MHESSCDFFLQAPFNFIKIMLKLQYKNDISHGYLGLYINSRMIHLTGQTITFQSFFTIVFIVAIQRVFFSKYKHANDKL